MATQLEQIKHVQGMPFRVTVDGFAFLRPDRSRSGRHLCILTHFHSDHTAGLTKCFQGELLCTQITADLVVNVIGVDARYVHPLELRRTYEFDGLEITALDAFHCPGAAIFLLSNKLTGYTVLHTGDFRAAPHLQQDELLLAHRLDTIFLDTTYCSPRYAFADQAEVLAMVEQITKRELEEEPDTCFVVGTYQIGKEKCAGCLLCMRAVWGGDCAADWKLFCRVVKTVVQAAGSKCFVTAPKERLLRLCQMWDDDIFTTQKEEGVRVFIRSLMDTMPNGSPSIAAPEPEESRFKRVVLFRPTGWTLKKDAAAQYKPWIEGNKRQYAVPYSEHSSFDELVAFVRAMKPRCGDLHVLWSPCLFCFVIEYSCASFCYRRIIPTVNAVSDQRTENMLKHFLPFMDLSSDKKRLDSYFATPRPSKVARLESETVTVTEVDEVDEVAEVAQEDAQETAVSSHVVELEQTIETVETTEEVVDLESVDIEEQKRIWEQIRVRVEYSTAATTTTKGFVEEAAVSSQSSCSAAHTPNLPKRQSSLKAFFVDRKSSS